MADLISRQAAIKLLRGECVAKYPSSFSFGLFAAADELSKLSAVDAVEVVHGRWEKMGEADYKCSVCGFRFTSCDPVSMFLYCRCGAKMDGERREENAVD